jgi:hypothetical protein
MAAKTESTSEPSTVATDDVFINVAIPADLHRALRIRQITDGVVMRVVVTDALRAWLA